MNKKIATDIEIKMDLSFTGFYIQEYLKSLTKYEKILLTTPDPWGEYLKCWLEIIRKDKYSLFSDILFISNSFSIGLNFTDDLTIAKLNKHWLCKNAPTDVLSFPILDQNNIIPKGQTIELGDIVVSVPMAKRQAQDHNHGLRKELLWLVSHGLLHLLGWDHPDPNSLKDMLSYQELLLNSSVTL